jgi:hypothetical protein
MKKSWVKARDGHICDSKEEAMIDDFLCNNGIEHTKVLRRWALSQYFYPGSFSYPDWIIHGEFVEYLGLSGVLDYDKKVQRKINSAKKGKHYHFLLPYKKVFQDSCQILHLDDKGNTHLYMTDYRTYLLKRFKKHANAKIISFID